MSDEPKLTILVNGTGAENMRQLAGMSPVQVDRRPLDEVGIEPAFQGALGRAWRCDLAEGRRRLKFDPCMDGTLGMWVIEARWAHPIWHSYHLTLVHLRPMPDGRVTRIYLPGATHEMWLYALDPDGSREALIRTGLLGGGGACQWLTPTNFAAQLIRPDDASAIALMEAAVTDVCAGNLNPDADAIQTWAARFGDNMMIGRGL